MIHKEILEVANNNISFKEQSIRPTYSQQISLKELLIITDNLEVENSGYLGIHNNEYIDINKFLALISYPQQIEKKITIHSKDKIYNWVITSFFIQDSKLWIDVKEDNDCFIKIKGLFCIELKDLDCIVFELGECWCKLIYEPLPQPIEEPLHECPQMPLFPNTYLI